MSIHIIDSHEFLELYRGDKDLRLGIELCKTFNVQYTMLVPDVASVVDRKFFNSKKFPKERLPKLPKGMDVRYLKSMLITINRQNVNVVGTYFQLSFQYQSMINKVKPDLIYESTYTTLTPRSYMTYLAARRLQIPIIYVDAGDVPLKGKIRSAITKLEGTIIRYASNIIIYNESGKKRLMKEYNYPENKIVVIPKPIDTRLFSPKIGRQEIRKRLGIEERFVVSYVGRLSHNKGCHHLLEVAKQLKNHKMDKDYYFLFIGGDINDKEAQVLQGLQKKYNLDNIHFTGRVPHEQMNRYQAASDIVVFPDVTNPTGFPTVLAESMAMGKAIIIGNKDYENATPLVDDYNACIIEAGDVRQLMEAISELKGNDNKKRVYGEKVREFALSHMDWGAVASKYYKIFEEAVTSQ